METKLPKYTHPINPNKTLKKLSVPEIEKIHEMALAGKSIALISRTLDRSYKTVEKYAKKVNYKQKKIERDDTLAQKFENRAKWLLDSVKKEEIENLDIKTMSIKDRISSASLAIEKARLLLDKSTSNIASHSWIGIVEKVHGILLPPPNKKTKEIEENNADRQE